MGEEEGVRESLEVDLGELPVPKVGSAEERLPLGIGRALIDWLKPLEFSRAGFLLARVCASLLRCSAASWAVL